MKLSVDRVSATPEVFRFEGDAAWWGAGVPAGSDLPRALARPFALELRAHTMGDDLYLEGETSGAFDLECSRCLARYRHELREPFRLVLEPAGDRVPADPEGMEALARDGLCLGDALEAGWFRGSEIHLGHFFREVIALALPVKPLCREECRGLCPRCGVDRNETECQCPPERAGSPFAVLARLKQTP